MLLRTRISLLAATGFAVLALLLAGAAALRDQLSNQRVADTALAGLGALWEEAITVEGAQLQDAAGRIERSAVFRAGIDKGSREAAERGLAQLELLPSPGAPIELVAVLGAGREPLFSTRAEDGAALLDAATFDRVRSGTPASGLRHVAAGEAWLLAARRITAGKETAILVVGRKPDRLLQRMSTRVSAKASLLTPRGQLAATTDAALWKRAAPSIPASTATFDEFDLGDRIFILASVPVRDMAEAAAGAVVAIADVTERLAPMRRTAQLATFGTEPLTLGLAIGFPLVLLGSWLATRRGPAVESEPHA